MVVGMAVVAGHARNSRRNLDFPSVSDHFRAKRMDLVWHKLRLRSGVGLSKILLMARMYVRNTRSRLVRGWVVVKGSMLLRVVVQFTIISV